MHTSVSPRQRNRMKSEVALMPIRVLSNSLIVHILVGIYGDMDRG